MNAPSLDSSSGRAVTQRRTGRIFKAGTLTSLTLFAPSHDWLAGSSTGTGAEMPCPISKQLHVPGFQKFANLASCISPS
ncbi:hypothetical protein BRADI_3g30115v3 [Brachypodium distachyon]|uniref:Uncharacterized protein n=1 Tax=Brachypodium distachyon TaxID=15368 RepID=A0A2K2D048_BRADI|nr:hypothetical protein BRADI_3g30115v3 [Brachypodium distachyon]